jgi:hypothetical protein
MAGRGGDVQAGGSGPERPGPGEAAARVGADAQQGGLGGSSPRDSTVPAETLRSWDAAEARLFPLVMARPEEYERSLALIQVLLGWLRSRCQNVPALLEQSARGGAIVADAAGELSGDQGEPRLDQGGLGTGLRGDLIAAAACAMRYRELVASSAARGRRDALARASARGESWAVVEEAGDESRAPYLPYQRVEAHVPSGRAVIISIEPDETLNAIRRLDEGTLDPASGRLVIGAEIGSYTSASEFDNALARARQRMS